MVKLFALGILCLVPFTASALTFDQACRSPLHGYRVLDNPSFKLNNTSYTAGKNPATPGDAFGTADFNDEAIGYIDRLPGSGKIAFNHLRFSDSTWLDDFYTIRTQDVADAISIHGYTDLGDTGFVAPHNFQGALPIYRLFNDRLVDHAYTTSVTQKNLLISQGYILENTEGYLWPVQNKFIPTNGTGDKFFCFGNGTSLSNEITTLNGLRSSVISTLQAGVNDKQKYQFTLKTKDYFVNRASDHIPVILWGAFERNTDGNFTSVAGRGIAIGDTSSRPGGGCNGVIVEYFEATTNNVILDTCRTINFGANETYTVQVEATLFSLSYRLSGNGQDTGWVTTSVPGDSTVDPTGRTEVFIGASNDLGPETGPAHLEVLNNSVTITPIFGEPDDDKESSR